MEKILDSFANYIKKDRSARIFLWAGVSCSVLLFFIFKLFYPYPNMVMDSYVYIRAVVFHQLGANSYPEGYSWFLKIFSALFRSTVLLVWFQYLFLSAANLLFFLTLLFFFRPRKLVALLLFLFLFCNPIFFFCCNFIMSDSLFTALSILWVTQLIWLVCRPRPYMIWTHALLLLLVFTMRYNALYYPIVASLAFLLSRLKPLLKIAGISLQVLFLALFVMYTQGQMKQLTGVKQFSPFGGWQLANNALYMYGHVNRDDKGPVPEKLAELDTRVRQYFDTTHPAEELLGTYIRGREAFYMSQSQSPLFRYMDWKYGPDNIFQNFRKWGPMGETCSEYGAYLIRQYPFAYGRYFVWPNFLRYLSPPPEVFDMYSPYFLQKGAFGQMAKQLFDLKTLTVGLPLIDLRTAILSPYPICFALLNLFFVISFTGFCLFGGLKKINKEASRAILVIGALWGCNLLFSITASTVVLRYQIFIMIVAFAFSLLLFDHIYQSDAAGERAGSFSVA